MQIVVSGKNMDVGNSLRGFAEDRISQEIDKYLDRVTDANIVFSKEAHLVNTSISVNTGTHSKILIKSSGHAEDPYVSFNSAADKMEKQLRRYKRKIKNHHKPKLSEEHERIIQGTKYVLQQEDEVHEEKDQLIIAEKDMDIEHLTVGEAVMKMDLSDLPALLFINKASSRLNLVYTRKDGNISWVDPKV